MEEAAKLLGVSVPVLVFLIAFALTLPCSLLRRFVIGANNRHAYSALTGAVLSYYAFGAASNLIFLVPILGSYASMVLYRKRCGVLTAIIAFGYMIYSHLVYASGEAWKNGGIDPTGALMVLTLKVTSAAMNYQDGLLKEDDLRHAQKLYRLKKRLSILSYLGYCLNCGTHLAGPVYEMKDYLDWTEDKGLWSPNQEKPPPTPYLAAFRSSVKTLICMGLYVYIAPRNPLSWYSDPGYYAWPFWKRVAYQLFTGFVARSKYYFIWSLAEASVILSGFGFSGWRDSKPKWDRAVNVDIIGVEFAPSAAAAPGAWNIHVSTWLRHYVYERLLPKGRKPGFWQLLATQVVSGGWHGLYPGYILFFINTAVAIHGSKVIYRWQRALSENATLAKRVLTIVNWAFTSFCFNTTSVGFMLLGFDETVAAYRSIYFSGTFLAVGLAVFGIVFQPPHHHRASSSTASKRAKKTK